MAGSQLKRLKSSLREQGIIGPQKSKKQKRKAAQDDKVRGEKRLQRGVALEGIRQQFNPFDLKHAARGPKFAVTSSRSTSNDDARFIKGNPAQAKAASEERRRQTLLVDMQRRNKVGGVLDRRFGENDPTMAPEERMLERFAREKQRAHKKGSLFDLEEDDTPDVLTHGGRVLEWDDDQLHDDYQADELDQEQASEDSDTGRRPKRRRLSNESEIHGDDEEQPQRHKSKKEVMEEIIAKSKMHKYERQEAKEEDDQLRSEIDKELPNIQLLLSRNTGPANDVTDRISGNELSRAAFERNFDLEVKRLAQDRRAQPADRTKTAEELVAEDAEKLLKHEDRRQRRMRGESVSDSDEEITEKELSHQHGEENDGSEDEFGLGPGVRARPLASDRGLDDEDDFLIDDSLVASGSDLEIDEESDVNSEPDLDADDQEQDDFIEEFQADEVQRIAASQSRAGPGGKGGADQDGLPFTFTCPQSYTELVNLASPYPWDTFPTIIQRIRALHHPKLASGNKELLAMFSKALVDFVASSWDAQDSPSFSVLETVIRHIHSLAKMFPIEISTQIRYHIEEMGRLRPLALLPADLTLLTAVGTIFPPSDHFHQVVTPAILTISRYLGQKITSASSDLAIGTYLTALAIQYQQLSKRYVPEIINWLSKTICTLAPNAISTEKGAFPSHTINGVDRLAGANNASLRKLTISDCIDIDGSLDERNLAILHTSLQLVDAAATLWSGLVAFIETFEPFIDVLTNMQKEASRQHLPKSVNEQVTQLTDKLKRLLRLSQLSRQPLKLHNHRPLAIKTFVPRFEDTFDPDKHYDPDRDRAEMAKLKAEHRRERKGAMRELRKDANFMARENLRAKKAKDEAYEKKYKRLVAEIQSEEGREANAYEREKKARKRAKHR